MSNSVKIEELLTAVDQATRPFKNLQTATVSLSDSINATQQTLRDLHSQVAQIDSFTRAQSALTDVSQQLKAAKENTRALAAEMKKSDKPARDQASALDAARASVSKLQQQHDALRLAVKSQRRGLQQAGISTRAPATARNRLQGRISESREQLSEQRQALTQENRQARAAKIQRGKASIVAMGGKVSAIGNTSMTIAKTGFNLGKKLLQPGYEQSLKNTPPEESLPATLSRASKSAVAAVQPASGASASTAAAQSAVNGGTAVASPAQAAANTGAATPGAQSGNLGTDLAALQAAYDSLSVDIFSTQESSLRLLVQTATSYLGQLQQWVQNNQGLVQTFGLIATVVVGVAGAIGTVASVIAPVFTGISALITIATTVGSVFTTVFTAIGVVIAAVGWPITLTFAAIATIAALVYAKWEGIVELFNKARNAFNTFKAKLGFGDESEDAPQQAANAPTAGGVFLPPTSSMAGGTAGYIAPTSSMAGYQGYQPARAGNSSSYVDQSKSEYHITLQGDAAPGSDSSRQLMDMLKQHEIDKRNNALSQLNPAGGF